MFETRNLWSRVGFILFWCLRVSGILIVTFLFFFIFSVLD
jgi:succinate dehydrogenase hydrophobic anchor subunit